MPQSSFVSIWERPFWSATWRSGDGKEDDSKTKLEDSLWKFWRDMVCLSRPYPLKFFKDCLPHVIKKIKIHTANQLLRFDIFFEVNWKPSEALVLPKTKFYWKINYKYILMFKMLLYRFFFFKFVVVTLRKAKFQ